MNKPMNIAILQSFQSLVSEFKRSESQNFKVNVKNKEQERLAIIRTFSKRFVEKTIEKKIISVVYSDFIKKDQGGDSSSNYNNGNDNDKNVDNNNNDYEDDFEKENEQESKVSKYFIKTSNILKAKMITNKNSTNTNSDANTNTNHEATKEENVNFDFKTFFDKQMSHQVGDAVKIFEHLQNNLYKSCLIKEKLSTIQSFHIHLDKLYRLKSSEPPSPPPPQQQQPSSPGIGMIFDPKFTTNNQAVSMKITYQDGNRNETMEISLQSSSVVPDPYNLTTSPQTLSKHHTHHLPGWDGVSPAFIPSYDFHCELWTGDEDDTISYPITVLIFPVSSFQDIFPLLKKTLEDYHLKALSNTKVMGGMPILNLAALQGETKIVTNLLTKGGNPNFRSPVTMNTSLHEAIYGNHSKILSLLLDFNGDQLLSDYKGNLPLHIASSCGFIDMIRMLLQNSKGDTALYVENEINQKPVQVAKTTYIRKILQERMDTINPKKKKQIKAKQGRLPSSSPSPIKRKVNIS